MKTLILTPLEGIPILKEGDDLVAVIQNALEQSKLTLEDGDILVIAQKVVSKAEGRMVNLADVMPRPAAVTIGMDTEKDPRLVELILQESKQLIRKRSGLIIAEHKNGYICANAGIDASNVAGTKDTVLLLPEDSDASAKKIQARLIKKSKAKIGIVIIDSHGRPWRNGTLGLAIGIAGVPGTVDLRGTHDLFGYEMKVTVVAAADELAAAASLVMGQVAEGTPVIHARGFPYELRKSNLAELIRPAENDMFR